MTKLFMTLNKKRLIVITLFPFFTLPLFSSDIYVGVRTMATQWNPAVLQSASKQAGSTTLGNVLSSSGPKTYKEIEASEATLIMRGITVSYIKNNYSFNYSLSLGNSNFKYSTHDYNGETGSANWISWAQYDTTFKVNRVDHDFSFSRLIGNSGFYFFVGAKKQTYTYDLSRPLGTGFRYGVLPTGYGTSAQFSLVSNNPYGTISLDSLGPAGGIGYVKPLNENHSLSASIGLLYLYSNYSSAQTYYLLFADSNAGVDSTNSYVATNYYKESARIQGVTASLGYNFKFSDSTILQIGYIRQQSTFIASNKKGYSLNSSLSDGGAVGSYELIKNATTNNLTDIYQGIVLAFQYKLY